jgi:hypothetical protein
VKLTILTPNARSLSGLPVHEHFIQATCPSSDGGRWYNVSLLVKSRSDVETYCSCPDGWINAFKLTRCKHVIALIEQMLGRG